MTGPAVLFRADGGARMGAGHLMRCVALAGACRRAGARPVFVSAADAPALRALLSARGYPVFRPAGRPGSAGDMRSTARRAEEAGASWVVLDGYHFGAAGQEILKAAGKKVLAMDDYGHAGRYAADLVLNPNGLGGARLYRQRSPRTRLLLGPRYALLRDEFKGRRRAFPAAARKVLVTLGGGDPRNAAARVLRALQRVGVEGLRCVLVAGGANPRVRELRAMARRSRIPARLERNPPSMARLMAWADVAVAAGGGTAWELAAMGLPSVLLVLAANQRAVVESLMKAGAAAGAPAGEIGLARAVEALCGDASRRERMSRAGRRLVDGRGCERVARAMGLSMKRGVR